jgi:hypothetical protein
MLFLSDGFQRNLMTKENKKAPKHQSTKAPKQEINPSTPGIP